MKKHFLAITLILLFLSSNLISKEQITWLVVHWPPFQMLEGSDKGKGRFDALLNIFRKNLPQYEHRTTRMNWARFRNDVKDEKNVCSFFSIKTKERLKYAEFSRVVTFVLPLRIIMRKTSIKKLENPKSLSLAIGYLICRIPPSN